MRQLLFDWGVADYYGWGVYGFNLLYWALIQGQFKPIPPAWPPRTIYPPDPMAMELFARHQSAWTGERRTFPGDVVLRCGGNEVPQRESHDLTSLLVTFFESNPLPPSVVERMRQYSCVVAGSRWTCRALADMGLTEVRYVIQGVDTDLFCFRPKRVFRDRFVVFSGGKLEYRKGQDLVVKAFSRFAARHAEALLLACWRSPWETQIANSINSSGLCAPLVSGNDLGTSIRAWLQANGIRPEQYVCLNPVANRLMPEVFREVDVALFPNRCESGTNLVAMEAMSSGVTTILSRNTGHIDLMSGDNSIVLESQRPVGVPNGTRDWGESDVDEIDAALEGALTGRLRRDPARVRQSMLALTWENSIATLQRCALDVAGEKR